MVQTYELTRLDPASFEHMANLIAIRILGAGHTGFGPGPDGGRDGYFEGEAAYPSDTERWTGRWYIQSKFHTPHLSKNAQQWLLEQIKNELAAFQKPNSQRIWPDNWIVVTNIEPSGAPGTGVFDKAKALVEKARPGLGAHFHIWGGRKVLDLLAMFPEIAEYYYEFITPGQVLASLYHQLTDVQAGIRDVIRFLAVSRFAEQQFTKLEQAGSTADTRPGIHRLFTDLPFASPHLHIRGMAAQSLAISLAQNHRIAHQQIRDTQLWKGWLRDPRRARTWFIKGGPGQGKSTLAQYFCQIQRAALILGPDGPDVSPAMRETAQEIQLAASAASLWPTVPRIPVSIELRDFAQWFGSQAEHEPHGILPYLAKVISKGLGQRVHAGTLKRAFGAGRWLFVFDGLDEVPGDVKEGVSGEVQSFVDDILIGCAADVLSLCTSRPQGYSGQFTVLEPATVELVKLSEKQALACAAPILAIDRSPDEAASYLATLTEAIETPSIREIMTTPLQSHIMAVVVRDGGKPPERKWLLFTNFYQVIKKREANRNLPDKRLSSLLREGDQLIKALHNRLGFELHARAETSQGAQTSLDRDDLRRIVHQTVTLLQDTDVDATVATLMNATTDRLVLVNTPESGERVRFDIRPLQEFFAAEYIYDSVSSEVFAARLRTIASDSHWREVLHFMLSALVENSRHTELSIAVEVLSELNEVITSSEARTLSRRLALGAVIASRLLQEGVLEQDKRVRQQFRKCLEPLFACPSAPSYLDSVERSQSKAFLQNALIDALLEQAEAENIGAAALLALRLQSDHPRFESVREYFDKSSSPYASSVLQIISSHGMEGKDELPTWIIEWTLSLLLSPNWTDLGVSGITAAMEVLSEHGDELPAVAARLNLDPVLIPIAVGILCAPEDDGAEIVEDVAYLRIGYERIPSVLCYLDWDEKVWSSFAKAPGIFQLLYRSFRLARDRNRESLSALAEASETIVDAAYVSPLAKFLPSKILSCHNDIDETRLCEFFEHEGFRSISSIAPGTGRPGEKDWREIVVRLHGLAVSMLLRPFPFVENHHDGFTEYMKSDEGSCLLIEVLEQDPRVLLNFVGQWGELSVFNERLRSTILKAASGGRLWRANIGPYNSIEPFELILPSEAPLLPYVVQLLTAIVFGPSLNAFYQYVQPNVELRVEEAVQKYVSDPAVLSAIIEDEMCAPHVRAAAAVLCLRHPGATDGYRDVSRAQLALLYTAECGFWFLPAVAFALNDCFVRGDVVALSVISTLLESARRDFEGRLSIEPMLRTWREISRSPVQDSRTGGLWDPDS